MEELVKEHHWEHPKDAGCAYRDEVCINERYPPKMLRQYQIPHPENTENSIAESEKSET